MARFRMIAFGVGIILTAIGASMIFQISHPEISAGGILVTMVAGAFTLRIGYWMEDKGEIGPKRKT